MKAVEVKGLSKSYGKIKAVKNVSFEIEPREIFVMVGPNGAGKTTTIESMEGLREFDQGQIKIFGSPPNTQRTRSVIGVQLQETSFQPRIKVREILNLFCSFYENSYSLAEISDKFHLDELLDKPFRSLSGGQKQRVNFAIAVLNKPKILFLDEPTSGLDPQSKVSMWDLIREMRQDGKTIFFTTHYMEEAEMLADRVAIIDYGRIVAIDTPERLIKMHGGPARISFDMEQVEKISEIKHMQGVISVEQNGKTIKMQVEDEWGVVKEIVRFAESENLKITNLQTARSKLEDVFLALTGREMRE
jgi:ABC-2 type transport system ATP-binding protein